MTDKERRKLVGWWVFYQLDYSCFTPEAPERILEYVRYAEEWPRHCDVVLREEYLDYRDNPVCFD